MKRQARKTAASLKMRGQAKQTARLASLATNGGLTAPRAQSVSLGSNLQKPSLHQRTKPKAQLPRNAPKTLRIAAVVLGVVCAISALVVRHHLEQRHIASAGSASNAKVVSVIDGDTITATVARKTEIVRLIGIDTPETVHPTKPQECFGQQASAFTKSLLPPETEIRLVLDTEKKDRFGRLLAYVHRASDNKFVNLELVRHGYAKPLEIAPNDFYSDEFASSARQARASSAGLWGYCASKSASKETAFNSAITTPE